MTEGAPRLRVERLVIVESRSPPKFIRDVPMHAGLNVVWAEELAASEGGSEVQRAGHGVGKSTFSLMLRAVLGDDGIAVKTMRAHLAEHFASGGIAAELVAGTERFAVFRSFGASSFALRDATAEQLFEEMKKSPVIDFASYVATLGEQACFRHMTMRALPVTGQTVEWGHVLCWLARDQALGLRQYFEWRSDDGTGLRRKVKDPPALTRLVLGLTSDVEAQAEATIAHIGSELELARDNLRAEEQRATNTRAIVERQLRNWLHGPRSLISATDEVFRLRFTSDDLFTPSVEKLVTTRVQRFEEEISIVQDEIEALDEELIKLAPSIDAQRKRTELAEARLDEACALRSKDDLALAGARTRRETLERIVGTCPYGGVAYEDCKYVVERRRDQLSAQREIARLKLSIKSLEEREAVEAAIFRDESTTLDDLLANRARTTERKKLLKNTIRELGRELGQADSIRNSLSEWEQARSASETDTLQAARAAVNALTKNLEAAKARRVSTLQQVSERERSVHARFGRLAEVFGAKGRYVSVNEKRPFQMLRADGDAYTVLEILLGDLACAAECVAANGGGGHPGFLIFDCPREREMSPQLYERFLQLVDEVCKEVPGLQVVITTTTPPPKPLGDEPTRILKLSHASDDTLLLKCRVQNLLARAIPAARDDEEGAS